MGFIFSKLCQNIYEGNNRRILMLGLDAAGKTTILYKLRLGEIFTSIPTLGLIIENLESRRFSVVCCDVGGASDTYKPLLRLIDPKEINGLIFVIDSNDHERAECAKSELQEILRKEAFFGLPLLIIANKQDKPNAICLDELTEKLELYAISGRNWYIQGTCAYTGEGIKDAFKWIEQSIDESNIYIINDLNK